VYIYPKTSPSGTSLFEPVSQSPALTPDINAFIWICIKKHFSGNATNHPRGLDRNYGGWQHQFCKRCLVVMGFFRVLASGMRTSSGIEPLPLQLSLEQQPPCSFLWLVRGQ
jgi:hypothetical protein